VGKAKGMGESEAREALSGQKRRLFKRLTGGLLRLYHTLASHLLEELHGLGVSAIYTGYSLNIAQEEGNELAVNICSYRKPMDAVKSRAQEHGVKAFEVVEHDASEYCAYHGGEVKGGPRGVASCPLERKLHSDLNCALNILKKANAAVSRVNKPLSFLVDHNGVAPVKGA